MTKINQKNAILMSEKILVTLINKGFSQKYVRIVNPLKQGLRHPANICLYSINYTISKNSESIKIRIETTLLLLQVLFFHFLGKNSESIKTRIGTKN